MRRALRRRYARRMTILPSAALVVGLDDRVWRCLERRLGFVAVISWQAWMIVCSTAGADEERVLGAAVAAVVLDAVGVAPSVRSKGDDPSLRCPRGRLG